MSKPDGHYQPDGSWKSESPLWRDLTATEVEEFKKYARENVIPPSPALVHPVCKAVWGIDGS